MNDILLWVLGIGNLVDTAIKIEPNEIVYRVISHIPD
jgi:hypothetical protein